MHLLVIEDERALCETIVRSLRRLAYSVDYCYDGDRPPFNSGMIATGNHHFERFAALCNTPEGEPRRVPPALRGVAER